MGCGSGRQVLRSADRDRALEEDGYVVERLLDAAGLAELTEALVPYVPDAAGFHSSAEVIDPGHRTAVHRIVVEALGGAADELFVDHRPVTSALLVKWPGPDGVKWTHQDLTIVDEERFRATSIWLPLHPVGDGDGTLGVLPGSHRTMARERTAPRFPPGVEDPLRGLHPSELVRPALAPGEGVVYDMAVAHGSGENTGSAPRLAVGLAFVPAEAELRYLYCSEEGVVERYVVEDPTFFQHFDWMHRPDRLARLEADPGDDADRVPEAPRAAAAAVDDDAAAPPGGEVRPGRDGAADGGARRLRSRLRRVLAGSRGRDGRAPTFRDDRLQRQFERAGYVVVPLVGPEALERLRGAYRSMAHVFDGPMLFAEGFHTTLYDRRPDYRRQVRDAIAAAVGPPVAELLVDHELQFANFAVKHPAGAAVPEHLDWTFVDESVASSVTLWCAMDDMAEHEGCLGVVPGSHRRVEFLRAANERHPDRQSQVAGGDLERVVVRLAAGEAIVFDDRTIHFSPPNRSDRARVAAACVFAPRRMDVVHYWFDGEGRAHRLTVTPEFWVHYEIGADPRDTPGCVGDVLVDDADLVFL